MLINTSNLNAETHNSSTSRAFFDLIYYPIYLDILFDGKAYPRTNLYYSHTIDPQRDNMSYFLFHTLTAYHSWLVPSLKEV